MAYIPAIRREQHSNDSHSPWENENEIYNKPYTLTPDFALVLFYLCKESIKEGSDHVETTIKVENLSKSYANVKAVVHLNLSICRGEGFGLLGANGAGKSKRSVDWRQT